MSNINLNSLTREEIFKLLDSKESYSNKDFKIMLSTMKKSIYTFRVSEVKIGDIHKVMTLGHPAVIIAIKDNICYSLLLTTEETTVGILGPIASRYINGYVSNTIVTNQKEMIKDNIITIYGNNKELSSYKKQFKELIKNL